MLGSASALTCSATACDSCLARSGSAAVATPAGASGAGTVAAWLLAVVCGRKRTDDLRRLDGFYFRKWLIYFRTTLLTQQRQQDLICLWWTVSHAWGWIKITVRRSAAVSGRRAVIYTDTTLVWVHMHNYQTIPFFLVALLQAGGRQLKRRFREGFILSTLWKDYI